MKRTLSLFIILCILANSSLGLAENQLDIFGEGAILIDANTSQVLYEKNPHTKLYPASTTKIMTAILALELGQLDDIVTIDQEVVSLTEGSHIALEPGEQLTLEQMLYALLIESANDAALGIAKHISGDIGVFVDLMNKKAKELGAENTNFVNPNGLHDDNHYSTAYDLALMGQYAMKNDVFRSIVKEYIYTLPATNKKKEPRYLKSVNRLVYSTRKINVDGEVVPAKYEGANGIKTGYTSVSQNCLVSSVERDQRHLIAVVLKSNGENVFSDSHKLYNYGFQQFSTENLGFTNQFIDNFQVSNGLVPHVAGVLEEDVSYTISNQSLDKINFEVIKNDIKAPLKKGDVIGSIKYFIGDNNIMEANIVSTMDVEFDKSNVWYKKLLSKWYIFVFILYFINRIHRFIKLQKIKKRRSRKRKTV